MKPSQYQRQLIYELANEGCLECWTDERTNGKTVFRFRFSENAFHKERWREAWQAWSPEIQMTLEGALR
jgi:hypothetical protein